MEKTPISMRKHIAIIGETNSGKSTLFNLLLGQELAIVSEIKGTTTDPIIKAMELNPYGPVALIDTAGFGDDTELGRQRMKKTEQLLARADLIIQAISAKENKNIKIYDKSPCIVVYTMCELLSDTQLRVLKDKNPNAVFLSDFGRNGIDELRHKMVEMLNKSTSDNETFIGDLLPENSTVVMVVPIDSAAPKGRLILPQVQLIRDCLDNNIKAHITKETTLKSAIEDLKKVDLVITDSQIFSIVDKIVPKEIPLTSFSMLLARVNGNFTQYLDGAEYMSSLKDGDKILMLEGCTHNKTHEDIGRVKIPAMIEKKLGVKCEYDFYSGYEFPEEFGEYKLAISCGMCMINKREVLSRLEMFKVNNVPVVNYGIAIAKLNGILDRAKEIFNQK